MSNADYQNMMKVLRHIERLLERIDASLDKTSPDETTSEEKAD
jgi:hypothetical protein